VVQITYKKDATSKRNQGMKGKLNPKRDRKKMMADLFNDSDSDQEEREEKPSAASSSISLSDLEEKRKRVKEKLSGERQKTSPKKSLLSQTRRQNVQTNKAQNRNEEDDKFVVADHVSSMSESGEDPDMTSESEADERRKRLEDRKKKKGGDVLSWMNKSAKVKVNVQTNPKSFIQDMAQYKLRLHFLEDSSDSEPEKVSKSCKSKDEEESSDDSIPRGRRINPLKSSSSSDSEDERKRRVEKKKKKKKRIQRRSPSPVEEVVWTPSMYQKWDKNRKLSKRKTSDSDTDRPRPKSLKFQRSASIELKKSTEYMKHKNQKSPIKMQRSVSTIETSAAFGKPGISWPASSLPKIPKLKKSESKNDQ